MNIFILHEDPKESAKMMCDKHVVKMILESNQMLCTVAKAYGCDTPYRSTHAKHPCTIWVGESIQNWNWLIKHSRALCKEYTARYGRIHKSQAVTKWAESLNITLPDISQTPFKLAMPSEYKTNDPVESYRNYYIGAKARFAKWKLGNIPSWWPTCPDDSVDI